MLFFLITQNNVDVLYPEFTHFLACLTIEYLYTAVTKDLCFMHQVAELYTRETQESCRGAETCTACMCSQDTLSHNHLI